MTTIHTNNDGATITGSIMERLSKNAGDRVIMDFSLDTTRENQLLFFFKPHCFPGSGNPGVKTEAIIKMALQKLLEYRVDIAGILLLDGQSLEDLSIMDRHYGFINRLSKNAGKIVSPEDRQKMFSILQINDNSSDSLLGGHEFLSRFPQYDETSLSQLWDTQHSHKLRSGFYFNRYTAEGQTFILINGFHPIQLRRFTHPAQQILIMLLNTDTDWHILKNDLAGDTYPEKAKATSIRGEIFLNKEKYGIPEVTISNNGVHLSAGPFEALFEIDNFLKNINETGYHLSKTNITRLINTKKDLNLSPNAVEISLKNPSTAIGSATKDLFTITEEMNTNRAISEYLRLFPNETTTPIPTGKQ